jgi:N-acetylglutamate synthase-like GNAT family acetyltransferase
MIVRSAKAEEMEEIISKAGALDLDLSEARYDQFVVACNDTQIVGFGRLRTYPSCMEVATVGVVQAEQHKGIGSVVVAELLKRAGKEVFVTSVIPGYFSRFGFRPVKDFPEVLMKKLDFCRSFGFHSEEIFVMKFTPAA